MTRLKNKMAEIAKRGEFATEGDVSAFEESLSQLTDKARKHVEKFVKVPSEQLTLSFMPTDFTRTTPFFPMSKRHMKDRPYEELTWENPWGKVSMSGKRLSIHDESVLLALLHLVKKQKTHRVSTTMYQLCKVQGVSAGKSQYNTIFKSFARLRKTTFVIRYTKGKGKKKERVMSEIWGFVDGIILDEKTGKLAVSVNGYFLKMYGEGFVTSLDIGFRASLKGDITKALYRFLQGQGPFIKKGKYEIHLLKLCAAINLDANKPMKKLKWEIKNGLKELRKQKYIRRYMVPKNDVVTIWRDTSQIESKK
jgi:hypothetical protein